MDNKENKKIIITDAIHCMEVINDILNKTDTPEKTKYASYVSMAYFVKNLHVFPKHFIEKVLNDEKLNFAISAKSSYELLENAVKNKQEFKVYAKKWFHNVKANQEILYQYLDLLLKSNDKHWL